MIPPLLDALPVVGDVLCHTVSPLLGWLQIPLLQWAMFSPRQIPERFRRRYSTAMAPRPSQLRATAMDGALMIPGAVALRDWRRTPLDRARRVNRLFMGACQNRRVPG